MRNIWFYFVYCFFFFQIPGLIIEPVLFVIVGYWLSGMRATLYAFVMTTLVAIMVMNVSTACGKSILINNFIQPILIDSLFI